MKNYKSYKNYSCFISLLILSISLLGCGPKAPPNTHGLLYPEARQVKPFVLDDQFGQTVTEQALKGNWTLLFLGYTSCPDICPMTLAKLTQVEQQLNTAHSLAVWFVSVDPKRDTVDKRKLYIDYFNPSFKAVSGDHRNLFPFVRNLGLVYAMHDNGDGQSYLVDHSASVALVDPNGAVRAIFKPEFAKGKVPIINIKKMIEDLTNILTFYSDTK
jgi:protein SCO1/2